MLQALNPLVCVGCMPLLTGLWARQAARGAEPAPLVKMAIGCALQGAAWGLMALGSDQSFGQGGNYDTPIEEALPDTSDVRGKKI